MAKFDRLVDDKARVLFDELKNFSLSMMRRGFNQEALGSAMAGFGVLIIKDSLGTKEAAILIKGILENVVKD